MANPWTPGLTFDAYEKQVMSEAINDCGERELLRLTKAQAQECADRANAAPKLLEQRDALVGALERLVANLQIARNRKSRVYLPPTCYEELALELLASLKPQEAVNG